MDRIVTYVLIKETIQKKLSQNTAKLDRTRNFYVLFDCTHGSLVT